MRLGQNRKFALWLALAVTPAAALGQPVGGSSPAASPEMQKLLESCDAHKFQTTIHVTGDGEPYDSQVKVCGKQGQSDADWIKTLKDIVDKTAANEKMPPAVKDQVITAVNAEITRLTALLPREAPVVANLPPPRAAPTASLADDYSSLPPLPAPIQQPRPSVAPVASAAAALAAPALPAAPRLTLRCSEGRDTDRAEPCVTIERGNMLVVQAEDPTGSDVLLKFFRRDEARGEVRVPAMRPGQPVTVALPAAVCAGVSHSRVEIRASRAQGSSEATYGPYELRC